MHLRLFALLTTSVCAAIRMGSGLVRKLSVHREASDDCRGCLECSRDNGCVRCPERLFLFLQRDGLSHHGTCLHACPSGHYGQRGRALNHCMKCRSLDCDQCFSQDFCTRCRPGLQLYKGRCLSQCPAGTFPQQSDCLEDCLFVTVAEWSDWSACLRNGVTCGFRWGKQTRTRERGLSRRMPEEKSASSCPSHSETRRCRMRKRCATDPALSNQYTPMEFGVQRVLCESPFRDPWSPDSEASERRKTRKEGQGRKRLPLFAGGVDPTLRTARLNDSTHV